MARARNVPGFDCEEAFAAAAARVVAVRTEEVFERVEGVLDVERTASLHDMRVAIRRLRAALEMFEPCFPRKRCRKALKRVKRLADALGERRDLDVEVEFLVDFTTRAPEPDREALEARIGHLRVERARTNDGLAPCLEAERLDRLRRRLLRLAAAAAARKPRQDGGLDSAAPLRLDAARTASARVEELQRLAGAAFDPAAASAQHRLRIAAKRLRYALELTGPCLGPEAAPARQAARELQGVLGELHDCDVMLAEGIAIASLESFLRLRRDQLFRRFRGLWARESERGTWSALL